MRHFLAAAVFLTSCTSAPAQNPETVIVGFGANTCANIVKNYREGPKAMGILIISYAQGFWSGQNSVLMQAGAPVLKNLAGDGETHVKALMADCADRPSDHFGLVIRDYFFKLPKASMPK
jgi:hypothetical protein